MINNNDFKYIIKRIIIGLTIAFILFNVNKCNAKALVYKDSINVGMSQNTYSGSINAGNNVVINVPFTSNISNVQYDILVIKFGNLSFKKESDLYNSYCMSYQLSNNNVYKCNSYYREDGVGIIEEGNIYVQGALYYTNMSGEFKSTCYFTDELKDMMVCPVVMKDRPIVGFEYNLRNGGSDKLTYNISFNALKYYFNYDSTEIVNGLTGVQQQQQNTTQAIEDLTTNINDNNISGANSSTNNALSGIDNSVSDTLDNSISANQLNTILSNFTNQLSNTTCSAITLPIPYTTENIVLPCLGTEFSQRIPVIWALYELIITGVIVLRFWQHGVEFVLNVLDPYHIGANNVPTGGGK